MITAQQGFWWKIPFHTRFGLKHPQCFWWGFLPCYWQVNKLKRFVVMGHWRRLSFYETNDDCQTHGVVEVSSSLNPKARFRCTPAPSMVCLHLNTFFIFRTAADTLTWSSKNGHFYSVSLFRYQLYCFLSPFFYMVTSFLLTHWTPPEWQIIHS